VRGSLLQTRVAGASLPAPEGDICNPDIYWQIFFPDGSQGLGHGGGEVPACNFVYEISGRRPGDTVPPIAYMISIRHFHPPKGSDVTSAYYYGKNFIFAVTK
jgi:hypothetical protein